MRFCQGISHLAISQSHEHADCEIVLCEILIQHGTDWVLSTLLPAPVPAVARSHRRGEFPGDPPLQGSLGAARAAGVFF